jgi:XapX domain-containing protein
LRKTRRYWDIPSPAPPRLTGAFLVLAMTLGFQAANLFS